MPQDKPNILLVTTDQQRSDTTGPGAPSFMRTPHVDSLRREGVDFASAYAECPLCVPARISIMNGKSIFTHGMTRNGESSSVMGRENTLPALLRSQGYQTCAVGKMHFSPQRARHGFDEMILPQDYLREMRDKGKNNMLTVGLGQNELYPGMATVPEAETMTAWTAEKCVEYLAERRDPTVPFFLWCSFSKPHPPFDPPEPYYSMYRGCDIPESIRSDWSEDENCPEPVKRFRQNHSFDLIPDEVIREARSAYYGLITQIDYNLGRVLAILQDRGELYNTLIVYTSDHGECLGDHHCGSKKFFYEPSAHVPCILRMPESWKERECGKRVKTPVTHSDILPTLVSAAGGDVPENVDGQDLIGLVRGELPSPRRYAEGSYASSYDKDNYEYLAVTDGQWKYIWYPEGGREQLFDLSKDPIETDDLAGKNSAKCTELHMLLVEKDRSRGGHLISGDRLAQRDILNDSEAERRSRNWPGYHTEYCDMDVRH